MSASPVFSAAASGCPFIFSSPSSLRTNAEKMEKMKKKTAEILSSVGASPKLAAQLAAIVPASRLDVRPAPEMVSSGIPKLDSLTGGFARGCLTEICGAASSGRTSVLLFALACATQRGEVCALVDASDTFDPASAAAAGMEMNRLLWVRCGDKSPGKDTTSSSSGGNRDYRNLSQWKNPEVRRWESQLAQLLKVTDLLLQSNGFGMIALDLGNIPVQGARRIPLASWFRFRRVIESTPTVLLVLEQHPIAGSCSSALLRVSAVQANREGKQFNKSELPHSELLDQFEITVELLCSRLERRMERRIKQKMEHKMDRKPVQSTACFKSRAAWAG
jgi:hypothetical protein